MLDASICVQGEHAPRGGESVSMWRLPSQQSKCVAHPFAWHCDAERTPIEGEQLVLLPSWH